MDFKVGDVVLLKSGGAYMTVSHEAHDGKIVCVWHDPIPKGGFDNKTEVYIPETLELKTVRDERHARTMKAAVDRFSR